jgi:hypothetical protein
VPVPVLTFLHFGSVPVLAHTITGTGIPYLCPYWYWHFCTLVQYQYWHIPLQELALKNYAHTGIGIVAHCFIPSMGIVHYWYWHLILPIPVLVFLHLGSLPVQAQSITRIGIQIWCSYRYWHFCTMVQYKYGHIPLLELGSQHGARTGNSIFALRFSTGVGTVYYRYWHSVVPVPVSAFWHFGSVPVWAHTITGTGVLYGPYRNWHFCTSVQYRYRHIPLPVLDSAMVPVLVRAFLHFGSVPV